MLKKAERLFRIVRLLGDAHPEHVDRHAKLAHLETGTSVRGRVPPVRADDEVRTHFHFAARSFRADTDNALILNQQIDDFGLHEQLEGRETFGMT